MNAKQSKGEALIDSTVYIPESDERTDIIPITCHDPLEKN